MGKGKLTMDTIQIFNDGILMDVHVSFWTAAKALNPEDLGLKPEEVAEAYHLGRKMLIPEEVIREFRHIEGQARRVVDENSFLFAIGNARFVPKNLYKKVTDTLKEYQAKYLALVDDLIAKYGEYREKMLPIYREAAEAAFIRATPTEMTFGPEYDREAEKAKFVETFLARINSYYPSPESVRSRFNLWWDAYQISIPDHTLSDEYQAQMKGKITSFVDEVVKVLRAQTLEVCERVRQNLKEGKAFRGQTLSSLSDFIDKFKDLNFVGDKEMELKLEALQKEVLEVYPTNQINETPELQQELGRRINEIVEMASNLNDVSTVVANYRKINWREDLAEEKAA
ncbi:MAG: DUF3150 domain-containing protein [Candidatus Bathyarchaeia archaeon]